MASAVQSSQLRLDSAIARVSEIDQNHLIFEGAPRSETEEGVYINKRRKKRREKEKSEYMVKDESKWRLGYGRTERR